jgi:hypothetical protein
LIAVLLPLVAAAAPLAATPRVPREAILEAMRAVQGYDVTATTNGARFQSEVLLRLARAAAGRDPERRPLTIDHDDWFQAYLQRTGLRAEQAPLFVRLSHQYRQDMQVDFRPERVFRARGAGPAPQAALNVCIWWPDGSGAPDSYSYEDALSTPHLKVTNERVISYRLLDFGDQIAFNDIHGLRGRPTSGALGVLFQVIGEGSIVDNRMAIAPDGLQVARARARKFMIEVSSTVTVFMDGKTVKDVPPGRTDLAEIERRLRRPIDLDHPPFTCPPR